MKVLCIDTSMSNMAICLYADGETTLSLSYPDPKSHNRLLLQEIEKLLTEKGLTVQDMDAFSVVIGPGSFTGIRIGVATVNAFSMATEKPVIEVISLEQLQNGQPQIVLLDCKHGNYYASFFDGKQPLEYKVMTLREAEESGLPVVYLEGSVPEKLVQVSVEKAKKQLFSKTAKPFYIKKSSAETGE